MTVTLPMLDPEGYVPLTYHFFAADRFPVDGTEFETAMAPLLYTDGDRFPTTIVPGVLPGLPSGIRAFEVDTVTERHATVFAADRWVDHYLERSKFRAYLVERDNLLIIAAGQDALKAFLRSCREKSEGKVELVGFAVSVNRLKDTIKDAIAVTLVNPPTEGGLDYGLSQMVLKGRRVTESQEFQHFAGMGAVGAGLQFNYSLGDDAHQVVIAASKEGSLRLRTHIGSWHAPQLGLEVRLVLQCWREYVARWAERREPRKSQSAKGANKPSGPGPVEGQEALGLPEEGARVSGLDTQAGAVDRDPA